MRFNNIKFGGGPNLRFHRRWISDLFGPTTHVAHIPDLSEI